MANVGGRASRPGATPSPRPGDAEWPAYVKPVHRARFADGKGIAGGADIGPSTIAAVTPKIAFLDVFCRELENLQAEIAQLQRQQARRLRLSNPDNYEVVVKTRGRQSVTTYRVKKGARDWQRSQAYQRTALQLKELHRAMAAKRKNLHEVLAIKMVSMANTWHLEKLSIKAFQALYGKSIGFRAPASFMEILSRKAEKAGGRIVWIDTRNAKLSQYDHTADRYQKKRLSERWHNAGGEWVQRDLYSSFLAMCINARADRVCRRQADAAWPSVRQTLVAALQTLSETSSGPAWPASLGLSGAPGQRRSPPEPDLSRTRPAPPESVGTNVREPSPVARSA